MSEMKDSGIEWIGEIPKDWKRTSLLNLLRCKISDGPHETPSLIDEGIPFISVDSLGENQNIDFSKVKRFISEEDYIEYNKKANLEKGDILFSKAATIGKTAIVRDEKFMVWSPLAIIKADEKICNNKYIYYLLNCEQLIKYVSLLGGYNTQINVGMRTLEKAFVPFPNIEEQNKIAGYLDEKCEKIDQMIAKEKEEIEKLNEYKDSLIEITITKGLNKNVDMVKSELKWIDEIPKHWKKYKLSRLCSSKKYSMVDGPFGSDMKNEEYVDEGVPIVQLTNIKKYNHYTEKLKFITRDKHIQLKRHTALKGDIAIAKMMPAGRACILSDLYDEYVVAADAIRFSPDEIKVDKRFVLYCLNTYGMVECELESKGTTRIRISLDIARNIKLYLPKLEEQTSIADFLDKKCNEIEKTIKLKEVKIEKVEAYKKSLIYECVTGKRKVK